MVIGRLRAGTPLIARAVTGIVWSEHFYLDPDSVTHHQPDRPMVDEPAAFWANLGTVAQETPKTIRLVNLTNDVLKWTVET